MSKTIHPKAKSQIVLEYNILYSILAKTMLWSKNTAKSIQKYTIILVTLTHDINDISSTT